jgi:Clostripain family
VRRSWTVMVYLAGDNNLEAYGERDLAEMKAVGSTDAVAVVAQFDRMGDSVTRRYHLMPGRPLSADVAAELPETNTGDPSALLDFIRWGLAEYPAERTALILWNHGAGWKDDDVYARARRAGLSESELPRGLVRGLGRRRVSRALFATSVQAILRYPASVRAILFDDTSKDFLDNRELKAVLDRVHLDRRGRKLDLIGFDACLMNMIEVADQVQHACEWMVGSQEDEPGGGWPYGRILTALAADPDASPEALARIIVESYADYWTGAPPELAATQSALRLDRLPALVKTVGRLADRLAERLADSAFYSRALLPAMRDVQKFRDEQYVDLGHLGHLLADSAGEGPVRVAAREVTARLDPAAADSAVAATRAIGPKVASARGLSIYVPFRGPVSPAYAELEFARRCTWGSFLQAFAES